MNSNEHDFKIKKKQSFLVGNIHEQRQQLRQQQQKHW